MQRHFASMICCVSYRMVILASRRRSEPEAEPYRGLRRRLPFYGRLGLSIGWITRPAAEPRHLSHHHLHPPIHQSTRSSHHSPARRDTTVTTHLKFYVYQISQPNSSWELTTRTESPEGFVDADASVLDSCLAIRYRSWAGERGPFSFFTSSQKYSY